MFTFVTGGLRSGKSAYGLKRASEQGPPPWLYIAMGRGSQGDEELKEKLARSRRDQDAIWRVVEAPAQLSSAFEPAKLAGCGAVVVDGFTIWLANRIAATPTGTKAPSAELLGEIETLADRMYRSPVPIVLVTTEVGLGYMPQSLTDRGFMDAAGMANQMLAERAGSVVLMVSGVPLRLR